MKHKDKQTTKDVSYYEANKETLKEKRKIYIANNKAKIQASTKAYYIKNKDKIDEYNLQYQSDNKEAVSKRSKEYFKKNKEHLYIKHIEYIKNRSDTDPLYKLRIMVGGLPSRFARCWAPYNKGNSFGIIGLNSVNLRDYLNDNKYGFKYDPKKYDIDHIIPLITGKTKEQIIKLGNYKNLQLLPIKYNRYVKKNNKWDQNHFEMWLKSE